MPWGIKEMRKSENGTAKYRFIDNTRPVQETLNHTENLLLQKLKHIEDTQEIILELLTTERIRELDE
jgi:hypothetical protein